MAGFSREEIERILANTARKPGVYRFIDQSGSGTYIYRRWDGFNWFQGRPGFILPNPDKRMELARAKEALKVVARVDIGKLKMGLNLGRVFEYVCDLDGNEYKSQPKQKQLQLL